MSPQKNLIFGLHAVTALFAHQPERIKNLYIQKERRDKKIEHIVALAKNHSIAIEFLAKKKMDELSDDANHQGVIAVCKKLETYSEKDLEPFLQNISASALILILDGVQDPHNLGACFRSADAAGVSAIIAPKDNSVGITPVVTKVASGAAETIPFFQVTNLVRTLEKLKACGVWIYGAAEEGQQTLYQTDFSGSVALVLGAEGKGLRRLTREHCDALVKIPMVGTVQSLNVSVAAGIFLFEIVRQRNFRR